MSARITSTRVGDEGEGCEIRISGLNRSEFDKLQACVEAGSHWIKGGKNGRLETAPVFKPLPDPIDDDEMLPFWSKPGQTKGTTKLNKIDMERLGGYSSPSILIQSLCGYEYTPENYKHNARRLESFGFECLRSRRGEDGGYWEIWFLPALWCAEGELKKSLEGKNTERDKFDAALQFLARATRFGTLDVSVQRLAMAIE